MALFMFMFYTCTVSYRGSLNSVLTVTFFPQPIDTLGELAGMVNSVKLIWRRQYASDLEFDFRSKCKLEVSEQLLLIL